MVVFLGEWKQFEFNLILAAACFRHGLISRLWLLLEQHIWIQLATGHSALISLSQQDALKLVIAFFEVRDQPVNDVLESDISDNGLHGFSSQLGLATWAPVSRCVLVEKGVNAPLAESAHAFVDSVSVAVHTLA